MTGKREYGYQQLNYISMPKLFFFVSEEALTSSEVNHDTISVVNLKKKKIGQNAAG